MNQPTPHNMIRLPEPNAHNHYLATHIELLRASYRHWTGNELVDQALSAREAAHAIHRAAFVVASHDIQPDPVLNYGNRAALALWECDWAGFTSLPSRKTAEPVARAEREVLLRRVSEHGYIDDYSGIRVSTTGQRFLIERATVWNLLDEQGSYRGQAVIFSDWSFV